MFFEHPDGRATVVPRHAREPVGRGILRQIIRDVGSEPQAFLRLL